MVDERIIDIMIINWIIYVYDSLWLEWEWRYKFD